MASTVLKISSAFSLTPISDGSSKKLYRLLLMFLSYDVKAKWSSRGAVFFNQTRPGGVVGYQYTLYFPHKIPIYLKIVKCVILNT